MAELMSGRACWLCRMLIVVAAVSACNRTEQTPGAETQTATPMQKTNAPVTVTGCLRAGDASDTFVLTAARTPVSEQTATYQLHEYEGVKLAEHVGRQVEVSGTLRAQQEVSTQSPTEPAGKPTGTAGTPTVSTSTELDIKQLNVTQVRDVGGHCYDDERK
jgi:hypothetical protein